MTNNKTWKVLVVDDDNEELILTQNILADFSFEQKKLNIVTSLSISEARKQISENPDLAYIILDVAIEKDHEGLQLISFIRQELKNEKVRIMIRTGYPGEAPESLVIQNFEINDYEVKSELTPTRLKSILTTGLRTFSLLQKLEESKEKHRFLFDNTIQGVVYHDSKGQIIEANQSASRILGLTNDQLKGKTPFDPRWKAIHEDGSDYPGYEHPVMITLKTGQPIMNSILGVFIPEKEDYHWININSIPKFRENEKMPYEVIVTFEDITEVKNKTKQLYLSKLRAEENEKQFRLLFENMEQGFALHEMIYDEDHKPIDYRFLMLNKAFENLTGLKASEIVGKRVKEIIPMLEPEWIEKYGNVAQTLESLHFESYNEALKKHYDVVAYAPRKDYFAVIFTDVTNKKKYENELLEAKYKAEESEKNLMATNEEYETLNEELYESNTKINNINNELILAKERAEESDRLKTAFLQNMSHEIRTPMNAIMGFSELITKNFDNRPKLEIYSNIIIQRSKDLLQIIDEILDIAKIEAGQLEVHFNLCNLIELFEELEITYNEQKKRLNKQHIEFCIDPQCEFKLNQIVTDSLKLKQILINLIGNAFKFTDSGKIEIGCKPYYSSHTLFYVKDTGIGIPKEKQSLVFERFAQIEQEKSQLYGGAGLGLSIVKGLVKLLDGNIWLESEPGIGTTFYFTIPLKSSDNYDQTEKHSLHSYNLLLPKATILLVEDDHYNAIFIKEALANIGLNIIHTSLGFEALNIVREQPIDLILMDIRLPDVSGFTITAIIKKEKPYIKIIAQTAYASSGDCERALNTGCNDYISKPINIDLLLQKLKQHLS